MTLRIDKIQTVKLSFLLLLSNVLLTVTPALAQDKSVPKTAVADSKSEKATVKSDSEDGLAWNTLLQGDDLSNWTKTNFGGEGKVDLKDGELTMTIGQPLTGITYNGKDFPKNNYEMTWEAQRVNGQDFFAGVTFPIGEEFCSFIAGGWGGGLVGISSVDGYDASENETSKYQEFKNGQWYKFRVKVDDESLRVWIDDKEMVNVPRENNKFSTRIEVRASIPLGYCVFQCTTAVKNWKYRKLFTGKEKSQSSADPQFLRRKLDERKRPVALQTAVASYEIKEGKFAGAKIDLIGAVHVGSKEYYDELNKLFKNYDALLYELVANPDEKFSKEREDRGVYNPISAVQVGMKEALELKFQLDEVDYSCKNFVHADMSPTEFFDDMKKRKDSFMSMFARVLGSSLAAQASTPAGQAEAKILAAMMSKNRAIALRLAMSEQFDTMELQMSGLADSSGKSTLLTERNRKAMEVLTKQLEAGKRNLGVFYGAAHLSDMDKRLVNEFMAVRGEVKWLDAWPLAD